MAHGHAVVALDGLFEDIAEHAGFDIDDLALLVEGDQLVELAHVQHDAAAHRQRRARDVAAPGRHRHRNGRGVGDTHDVLDLRNGRDLDNNGLRRRGLASGVGNHRSRPPVAGPRDNIIGRREDFVGRLAQRRDDLLAYDERLALQTRDVGRFFHPRHIGRRRIAPTTYLPRL